jgi:hypothetical protein
MMTEVCIVGFYAGIVEIITPYRIKRVSESARKSKSHPTGSRKDINKAKALSFLCDFIAHASIVGALLFP